MEEPDPIFFQTPDAFGAWLAENHDAVDVQWVGFWKVATGKPSMRWEESVKQALRFGWIDGLRRSIDDEAYMIRFTPRRRDSHWSRKNVELYRALEAEGRIEEAGRVAWERRDPDNTGRASFESERATFTDEIRALLDGNAAAAEWFDDQSPSYRRDATYWVMSAKRQSTRLRRMKQLVADSAAGRRIKPLRR